MEVSDEYFEELRNNLFKTYSEHEVYQRIYLRLTGKRWHPQLFLTDPVNRATLETTKGGDNPTVGNKLGSEL